MPFSFSSNVSNSLFFNFQVNGFLCSFAFWGVLMLILPKIRIDFSAKTTEYQAWSLLSLVCHQISPKLYKKAAGKTTLS